MFSPVLVLGLVVLGGLAPPASDAASHSSQDSDVNAACGNNIIWSVYRQAGEDFINSGEGVLISEFDDRTLGIAVEEWMKAYRGGDVGTLLRLTMNLSDDHLDVERGHIEASLEQAPDILSHYIHYLWADDTNPAHVRVYAPVVFLRDGRCESPRVFRRAHYLRGWTPWEDQVDIHRKSESGPSGWS